MVLESEGPFIAKPTAAFLKGMLHGCQLVSCQWLEACLAQGAWVDAGPHLLQGRADLPGGPQRAAAARASGALHWLGGACCLPVLGAWCRRHAAGLSAPRRLASPVV